MLTDNMPKILIVPRGINQIVRRQVIDVLREVFVHEDSGLELTTRAAERLKKSVRSREAGRVKSLDQILAKYR